MSRRASGSSCSPRGSAPGKAIKSWSKRRGSLTAGGLSDIKIHSGRRRTRPRRLCQGSWTRPSRKAGLAGIVRRTGHCADMPAALLAAALVVVPSTEPEAFGRVAAEAQAMGTPVVVTDLGALAGDRPRSARGRGRGTHRLAGHARRCAGVGRGDDRGLGAWRDGARSPFGPRPRPCSRRFSVAAHAGRNSRRLCGVTRAAGLIAPRASYPLSNRLI